MNLSNASEIQTWNKNLQLKVPGWRFIEFFSMGVNLYEKVSEGLTYFKLPTTRSMVNVENIESPCAAIGNILARLFPPEDNRSRVCNSGNYFNTIKRDRIVSSDGLNFDIEKLDDLNSFSVNVFELCDDKTLTNLDASSYKIEMENEYEDTHVDIYEDTSEVIDLGSKRSQYCFINETNCVF